MRRVLTAIGVVGLVAAAAGCGSSSGSSSSASGSGGGAAPGAGALTGEAQSARTGDIPDNQAFLTFHDAQTRYSMKFPEGWTQKGSGANVTFSDKNNVVHILVVSGGSPTAAEMTSELTRLQSSTPSLTFTPPAPIQLSAGQALKSTYKTRSAPNPVTGRQVVLIVDRYEFANAGKRATVDLGTAVGVDNIDAYRKMINSFRWQ